MKKFEYKVENKFDTGLKGEKRLNELGAQGWELVAVNPTNKGLTPSVQYLFKREVST